MREDLARPRHHLSSTDLEFVTRALTKTASGAEALWRLLVDPGEIDRILDSDRLYASLEDSVGQVQLSPRLFFYLTVRRAFRTVGIEDRDLAEYVACMLADFSRSENVAHPFGAEAVPMLLSIDLMAAISAASHGERFHLYTSAGNHYLFMTSFFPAFIENRRSRRGAPGLGYYENVGRQSYAQARDHRLAREYAMEALFDGLVHAFPEARVALSEMQSRWGHGARLRGVDRRVPGDV